MVKQPSEQTLKTQRSAWNSIERKKSPEEIQQIKEDLFKHYSGKSSESLRDIAKRNNYNENTFKHVGAYFNKNYMQEFYDNLDDWEQPSISHIEVKKERSKEQIDEYIKQQAQKYESYEPYEPEDDDFDWDAYEQEQYEERERELMNRGRGESWSYMITPLANYSFPTEWIRGNKSRRAILGYYFDVFKDIESILENFSEFTSKIEEIINALYQYFHIDQYLDEYFFVTSKPVMAFQLCYLLSDGTERKAITKWSSNFDELQFNLEAYMIGKKKALKIREDNAEMLMKDNPKKRKTNRNRVNDIHEEYYEYKVSFLKWIRPVFIGQIDRQFAVIERSEFDDYNNMILSGCHINYK